MAGGGCRPQPLQQAQHALLGGAQLGGAGDQAAAVAAVVPPCSAAAAAIPFSSPSERLVHENAAGAQVLLEVAVEEPLKVPVGPVELELVPGLVV